MQLLGVWSRKYKRIIFSNMKWNGAKNKSKPLAFVGKGVCFDTEDILNQQNLWKI